MSLLSPTASLATAADGALLSAAGGPLTLGDLQKRFASRVAIVIPAYNEGENLSELLPEIPSQVGGVPTAVLVIDDGSADDTAEAAVGAGAVVARLPENRGGGAALRVGYALMVVAGAGVVVTMDADGQHRPEEIAGLAEPVLEGRVQLAQGSRILGSAEPGTFARELGIDLFNRLVRVLVRAPVTDCSNSFRAISPELLSELELLQPQFHAAEFLIEAITRGFRYEEVPVSVLRRQHGFSKKPPTLRYGLGFSRAIVSAWKRSLMRRTRAERTAAGRRAARHGAAERERAERPSRLGVFGRPAAVEQPQGAGQDGGGAGVADLEALQLVAHDPE
jgi:glycosyltransferase involved in cell wall biosynthesis